MISEAVISIWSHKHSQIWLLVGLAFVGGASYFDEGWSAAIRAPLSILTVIVVAVVTGDFLLWIFRRGNLGKSWLILSAAAVVLVSTLSIVGDALWVVMLAILFSGVLIVIGFLKSSLYRKR